MHIPQGMAYAFLAELPPYLGLYTSFFPPLIYFFFGTSRQIFHGHLGDRLAADWQSGQEEPAGGCYAVNATSMAADQSWGSDPLIRSRVSLACATCLCVGLIQLLMGILRLGFLTRYLSDPLISGFTMGVAVHVFSSQIKYVLGISVPGRNGLASLPLHYYDLACNIGQTNFVTLGIAAFCLILYVTKEFVNPRVRKKIKAPLPTELIIFPDLSVLQPSMAVEIITVAIIAFSVCVSLAKIFGKKYNYEVAPSQELIAYGICNTVGAFFHCWPAGSSLSRSAVQDSMGGKTQVAALVSSNAAAARAATVPNCCLSAIILVAIKGMLEQVKEAPILWRLSPYDFWTWIVTCLGVVLLSVDYGLIMGLAFSVFSIIITVCADTGRVRHPLGTPAGHSASDTLMERVKPVRPYDSVVVARPWRDAAVLLCWLSAYFVPYSIDRDVLGHRPTIYRTRLDARFCRRQNSASLSFSNAVDLREEKSDNPSPEVVGRQAPQDRRLLDLLQHALDGNQDDGGQAAVGHGLEIFANKQQHEQSSSVEETRAATWVLPPMLSWTAERDREEPAGQQWKKAPTVLQMPFGRQRRFNLLANSRINEFLGDVQDHYGKGRDAQAQTHARGKLARPFLPGTLMPSTYLIWLLKNVHRDAHGSSLTRLPIKQRRQIAKVPHGDLTRCAEEEVKIRVKGRRGVQAQVGPAASARNGVRHGPGEWCMMPHRPGLKKIVD
uniref:STAS domain-containing protein n=1 Tax=Macrostomum lignano TaxID=282301 RepID=A0A1I8FDK8_9PLAT